MYKKISSAEKITRKISEEHFVDNYLTKDTTNNFSIAVNYLDGKIDLIKIGNERAFYFISANVDFNINDEIVHCEDGDVLYLSKDTSYSAIGKFEAVVVNCPAFGVVQETVI